MTLSSRKEELLENLLKDIKPLEAKLEDNINMLQSQINAVKDATDAKHDKLLEHNNQAKEDIIAQVNANTDKIINFDNVDKFEEMTKELIKMAKEIKLKDEAWKEERRRLEFQRKFEAEENKRRIEELLEEQKIIAEKARKEQEKLNAQLGAKLEAKLQKLGEKTLEGAEEKIREADAVIQAREKLEKGDQEEPRRLSTMIKQDSRTAMTIKMSRKHGIIGIIFLLLLLVLLLLLLVLVGLTTHYAMKFVRKSEIGKERTIN